MHPRYAEIRARLSHASNTKIAKELGVDKAAVSRIRRETGITVRPAFTTAEEKWTTLVREVDGGHLEWLGERASRSGTPVMRFQEKYVSPAGLAFTKRTGRPPVGRVQAECEHRNCVAPAHVDDEPGRRAVRAQLRAIKGTPAPAGTCPHGHDQVEHGKFEPDGTTYCGMCKREQRRAARTNTGSRARSRFDQPAQCPDHGADCEADNHIAPPTAASERI
ncbi:hypothetical protein ACFV1C_00325 [Streptomyces sp. NPDC059605]|uniref:hypothetical protein n=1 Tax=Streptomyces sp. NPDC059605 TaxID=3346882 RepID=UPI0036A5AD16